MTESLPSIPLPTPDLPKKEASYVPLPQGAVAIIRGKSANGTPGDFRFSIQIGEVFYCPTDRVVRADITAGRATEGFAIPKGQHKGWVAINPVEAKRKIQIAISPFQENASGEVSLTLYDESLGRSTILRSAQLDASVFTEEEFDLNQENINNGGHTLSPKLSQLLYDFQVGQGQFAPESQAHV